MTDNSETVGQLMAASRVFTGLSWTIFFLTVIAQFFPVLGLIFALSDVGAYTSWVVIGYSAAVIAQAIATTCSVVAFNKNTGIYKTNLITKKDMANDIIRFILMIIPVSLLLYIVLVMR